MERFEAIEVGADRDGSVQRTCSDHIGHQRNSAGLHLAHGPAPGLRSSLGLSDEAQSVAPNVLLSSRIRAPGRHPPGQGLLQYLLTSISQKRNVRRLTNQIAHMTDVARQICQI